VADHYGLMEISEPTMSFEIFQQSVLTNNPKSFASKGIQMYVPISGAKAIQFEIHPQSDDEAQIIEVEGISDDVGAGQLESNNNALDTLTLDRHFKNYPKAWSSKGSFQSMTNTGRWTFDCQHHGQRFVSDVTDPLNPMILTSKLPQLRRYPIPNTQGRQQQPQKRSIIGRYFDDSSSVIDNDTIESLEFHWNIFGVTGFRMKWRTSGLQSEHGYVPSRSGVFSFGRLVGKYELDVDEHIVSVGIGTGAWIGPNRINRIRIATNKDREMVFGSGTNEDMVYSTTESDYVISFYGRASDNEVYELGVTTITINDTT
jgi:Jacalin-like lectin domain